MCDLALSKTGKPETGQEMNKTLYTSFCIVLWCVCVCVWLVGWVGSDNTTIMIYSLVNQTTPFPSAGCIASRW